MKNKFFLKMDSRKWDIPKKDGEGDSKVMQGSRDRQKIVQSSASQKAPREISSRKWN